MARKKKNPETQFLKKLVRNSFILSGLFFVSVFSTQEPNWTNIKPIIIFFLGYIFTELVNRYKLDKSKIPRNKLRMVVL